MREKIYAQLLKNKSQYFSGEVLSEQLGISRTAVSKHMTALKKDGAVIESKKNNGHKLIQNPDRLKKEYIPISVLEKLYCYRYFDSTTSTNDDIKRDAETLQEISVYACEQQVAGKGRRGRQWDSEKYKGIYFSMLLKPQISFEKSFQITCMLSTSIVKTIEQQTGLCAKIKWPNDILIQGKKVCGILTELSSDFDGVNYIVCGIGINVNHLESDFGGELIKKATSLCIQKGENIDRIDFFSALIQNMLDDYQRFKNDDIRMIMQTYKKQSIVIGRQVTVSMGNKSFNGIVLDINDMGELMLQTENEIKTIFAGEVSVRGENGYV